MKQFEWNFDWNIKLYNFFLVLLFIFIILGLIFLIIEPKETAIIFGLGAFNCVLGLLVITHSRGNMINHEKVLEMSGNIIKLYTTFVKDNIEKEMSYLDAFVGLSLAYKQMKQSIKETGLLTDEQISIIEESLNKVLSKSKDSKNEKE